MYLTKEQRAELILKTIAANTDRATIARSVTRDANGRVRGSQKDPVLNAAIVEAAKHGISKRTVQNARAKLHGTVARHRTNAPTVQRLRNRSPIAADFFALRKEITRRRKANHDDRMKHRWNPEAIVTREQTVLLDWIEERLDAIGAVLNR